MPIKKQIAKLMRDGAAKDCESCRWHYHEDVDDGYVCVNADSSKCTEWTSDDDSCGEWEGVKVNKAIKKLCSAAEGLAKYAVLAYDEYSEKISNMAMIAEAQNKLASVTNLNVAHALMETLRTLSERSAEESTKYILRRVDEAINMANNGYEWGEILWHFDKELYL